MDGGTPKLTGSATFTFLVTDTNDNPPLIHGTYDMTVPENTSVNSIIFRINATDKDIGQNSFLSYTITSGDENTYFYIDSGSGIIQISKSLDRETIDMYVLEITVADSGVPPQSAARSATVTVGDVNDNPPVFQPQPITVYSFSVNENVPVGTVVDRVNATDADTGLNGAVTYVKAYSIHGNSTHFAVVGSTGVIRTAGDLDREKEDLYVFVIRALDGGINTLTATATVSITIEDFNDNEPFFSKSLYTGTVLENSPAGTSILTVVVDDNDISINEYITLSIADSTASFYIGANSSTYVLYVKSPIDREAIEFLNFILTATDGGTPPLSFTTQIYITVGDANDNIPIFSPTFYNSEIPYNDECQLTVTMVTATDADTGVGGDITYYTTLNNYPQFFGLDPNSGKHFLDYQPACAHNV